MSTLSSIQLLTREQARLYQDANDVKQPAKIFTIYMATFEKIDVLCDDGVVGVYYDDPLGLHTSFLYLMLPCRANRYMVQAMWDYLHTPDNWKQFANYSWLNWKDYFLDVGFKEG
jgi:hypothetical protein